MFNKKQPSINQLKEMTGEHLRAADKLVRLKRYHEALVEIENAYKIDPKNMYTRSFLERTQYLIDKENERRLQVFGEIVSTSEQRMEALSQLFASAEEFIKEKKYPKAFNELAKVYRIDPKNYYAQTVADRIRTLMRTKTDSTEIKKPVPAAPSKSEPDVPPEAKPITAAQNDVPRNPENIAPSQAMPPSEQQEEVRRCALYKELLKECWADGIITLKDSELLHRARLQYAISLSTHCQIEADIKIDAYVDALRIVWQDGVVNDNEQEVLEIMRKKFGITQEEQAVAEKKFFALCKTRQAKGMILIVDNDYNNSILVARALINHGYDVKIERGPDEAFHFLNTHIPDLILSEAVFPRLSVDGFEFFQRTRCEKQLNQIPFLMMTDSDDAHIMRAGLRMGVDYIIPKPLHIGNMISIIEGKIKSGKKTPYPEKTSRWIEK